MKRLLACKFLEQRSKNKTKKAAAPLSFYIAVPTLTTKVVYLYLYTIYVVMSIFFTKFFVDFLSFCRILNMLDCWERMYNLMKKKGVKLTEVARKTGILQQTLDKQVKSDTLPNIEQAYELCRFFGISMENFTKGIENSLPRLSKISIEIAYAADNLNEEGRGIALNVIKGLERSYPLEGSILSNLPDASSS